MADIVQAELQRNAEIILRTQSITNAAAAQVYGQSNSRLSAEQNKLTLESRFGQQKANDLLAFSQGVFGVNDKKLNVNNGLVSNNNNNTFGSNNTIGRFRVPQSCYIADIDGANGGIFYFQFMPEAIATGREAGWHETEIMGSSMPHYGYERTTARKMSLSLPLFANTPVGRGSRNGPNRDVEQIQTDIAYLNSLVMPRFEGKITRPPKRVVLSIGGFLRMRCVVNSVNVDYKEPFYLGEGQDDANFLPMYAIIAIELSEAEDKSWSASEVRSKMDRGAGTPAVQGQEVNSSLRETFNSGFNSINRSINAAQNLQGRSIQVGVPIQPSNINLG